MPLAEGERHSTSPSTVRSVGSRPARRATVWEAAWAGLMWATTSATPRRRSHATRAVAASEATPLPCQVVPTTQATSASVRSERTVACMIPTSLAPRPQRMTQLSQTSEGSGDPRWRRR